MFWRLPVLVTCQYVFVDVKGDDSVQTLLRRKDSWDSEFYVCENETEDLSSTAVRFVPKCPLKFSNSQETAASR
jgi:hypothetical protein